MSDPKPDGEAATVPEGSPTPDEGEHVPEWAENIEHELRRITIEKQEKRDRNPGLYR